MNARLANKILLGSEKKKNRYWLNRVVKAAINMAQAFAGGKKKRI